MAAIVFYPFPLPGHLVSMVELAKLIIYHHPSLSIHVLMTPLPHTADYTAAYISKTSAIVPSITFHPLSTTLPRSITSASQKLEILIFEVLRLNNPNVRKIIVSISENDKVLAVVSDFFCYSVRTVADQLDIPLYFYYTSGAAALAIKLYFPNIHRNTTESLKDIDTLIDIPGLPLFPSKDMIEPLLDRRDKVYEHLLEVFHEMQKSSGILINTFESLERRAIKALRDGLCVTDGPTPPIYCTGPQIAAIDWRGTIVSSDGDGCENLPECLKWLDLQPSRSVVYLCFGSIGLSSKRQLKEIAIGLEKSGQRFLWAIKIPNSDQSDPDLESLLSDGFLDRTKARGFVVKSWAPQIAILSHNSVGGFVTHCGWNSVLESITCGGIPMVAWPLYAEQRFNRVLLVEEIKIALSMTESEDGFVSSDEVEKRVQELMKSEIGNTLRERTKALKIEAEAAMSENGSSSVALTKWIDSLKRN